MAEQHQAQEQHEQTAEELHELKRIRREKLAELQAADADPYQQVRFERDHHTNEIHERFEELEGKTVRLAGRMMSKRIMGKASFSDLSDRYGRLQLYIKRDNVGDEVYKGYKKFDIGDIIGVEGEVFRTQKGEISVAVHELTLLSKNLAPLPEKWHGLKDTDMRYRQRYVDLIINPEVRDTFEKRSAIVREIRNFMDSRGFMEVETPCLNTIPGGAAARPFITHHNALDIDMYMRIATELHLKRLIVGGFEQVYEIGRIFRNEGMDTKHNPEFTTIELYQAYTDYHGMMDITEDMVVHVCEKVLGTTKVTYQGLELDFSKGWCRMTMADAVKEYAGLDFMAMSQEEALAAVRAKGVEVEPGKESWGDLLAQCYDAFVEENLLQPTFIIDYPVEISPLAKRKASDPRLTERFECFVAGRELCNAFSELNDPIDQRARFERQVALRAAGDDEANMMDDDFINALEYGMPPTGGMGMGIDRLVMFLTDSASIRDVLLFPTMKPLDGKPGETAGAAAAAPKAEKPDFSKVKIEPLFEETVDFETFSRSDFRAVKIEACEAVPKSKKLLQFTLNDGTERRRTILSGIHEYYEPEELIGKTAIAIVNLPPRKMMGIESEGMLISAVHEEDGREGLNLLLVDDRIPAGAKLY
ncbi:lysine--tRNA ligase [Agathobaculum desmolans]|uniref:lysine--tRNA ligase n=1 Tax=Agathobaculum desmolans TaxID=39484 RepID=UPI0004E216F7|nr:lysine--tRNA ligase [Agathobaculum desmolans]